MKKISNIFLILGLSVIGCGYIYELIYSYNSTSREASGISLVIGFFAAPFLAVWAVLKILHDRKNNTPTAFAPISEKVKMRNNLLSIIFFIIFASLVVTAIVNTIF